MCGIIELVRTHFGEKIPQRKSEKTAEPHRSKPQKNPEKNIGSNHILRNRQFVFTPKIEYKLAAEQGEASQNPLTFPKWCPRQESNLHCKLRKLAFYPLNYEGKIRYINRMR